MRFSPEKEQEQEILREKSMQEFTFEAMLLQFRSLIAGFPDTRIGSNTFYSIEDAASGAFSIFFTQSPSFLSFQKDMEKSKGKSNAQTIFGMYKIPCDNHIRDLLDVVSPNHVFPMFGYIFNNLDELGHIDQFRSINNNLLIALDGTQYFSSKKISCKNCSTQKHNDGTITYSHKAITPVLVVPGKNRVISLEPEFITPQDGHKKQDCENTAAKRWLDQYGNKYSKYKATILGDDLYSNQPVCKAILDNGFNFILICKPTSHETLYQWLEDVDSSQIQTNVITRCNGKRREIDTYRFINQVPIRQGEDALEVSWCELTTTLEDGTIIYKNSFITNHEITSHNVIEIVKAGRARWKIENENNNILKTKGYNLEHNFGHGQEHLSSLLMTFNILAFLFHTVLEIFDNKYQLIRKELSARKTFFDDIRALTRYMCFKSWDDMLNFMIEGLEIEIPDDS